MKPLVIFGTGDIAQLAYFYFSRDSDRRVDRLVTAVIGHFTKPEFCTCR